MSFKYRFILSFVLLEAFFIILIVSLNFITIDNSSKQLIKEKIESNVSLLEQLIKVPISIYDLATLDNLVENIKSISYINSIVILDSQENILSNKYSYKHIPLEKLITSKKNFDLTIEDEIYKISYKEIYEEDVLLGSVYIIFDVSKNFKFINTNKVNTIYIIFIEIMISTILSYLIGVRLTNMLTELSFVAKEIGENKKTEIPFQEKTDEIGILAKSLHTMQVDIRERRRKLKDLALTLNNQKKKLIEAHKHKDDFLANMSHELKTPLNSINVISSIMMKNTNSSLDDKQVKNLSIINNCGNDLLYLINDILDLSKLEAGEIKLDYSSVDFYPLISSIKDMFEPQVLQKNIDFIFDCKKDIGFIYTDVQRIKQIVKNLLSNALKFVSSGSISLIVTNEEKDISILVKDTGIGIEEHKLEHIFDRFKQADSSTTRKYGGTGLGLAICKELLDLLEGGIIVSSEVNRGSIFTIRFPKNRDKVNRDEVIKEKVILDSSTQTKKKDLDIFINKEENIRPNILILNNDPMSFFDTTVELKKTFNIQQTTTFNDFKSLIQNNEYFAYIIDISNLKTEEIESFLDKKSKHCIIVYKNDISNELTNKASFIYQKPLNKDLFISKINELKAIT